ncbi:hypothetical protein APY04_3517 [Hyphomicrobium sulfonivorans]|uniref:Uncharacterized protein n=1 Tax=Hyphomicrobium sulfonivorans TaxID=121290 RepID=A0A109B8R7_HYPSL|nr:hypothetical protein [Hyphomicrobium sulfonivorans]KWT64253.1 hypothetical protein APY04_3517 [Hyphomicrobium sulfonivorans]
MKLTARIAFRHVEQEPTNLRTPVHNEQDSNATSTPGTPSLEFLEETVRVWQKYSDKPLTHDDARQIIQNMTGYFRLLQDMQRAADSRLLKQ